MAEKADKKPEAPAPAGDAKDGGGHKESPGGMFAKTPVLLGIVMVVEALVLFAGFKFLGGGPKPASAIELSHDEGGHGEHGEGGHDEHGEGKSGGSSEKNRLVELNVVDFKAPN